MSLHFSSRRSFLTSVLSIAAVVVATEPARAADWANAMFPIKQHEFGDVAVSAKCEVRFPIENKSDKTVHIKSVRASCGCTTPIIETNYIEPGQTGTILARFNTDTHRGKKAATLTVVIDKPNFAEVQLKVGGYIRQDLVFNPGSVEFGKIPNAVEQTRSVNLTYAGRTDWEILQVESSKPWITAQATLVSRSGINANYQVNVRVDPSAPQGAFHDELVLTTNDKSKTRVSLLVTGEVESSLIVSPQALALGEIMPGQVVEKKLVIRGSSPFLIDSIKAKGWEIDFDAPVEPKTTHLINARMTATGEAVGQVTGHLVVTAGQGLNASSSATVTAIIREK